MTYDVIVIGTGGVGSGTLFHLASRGARVLGIDRFGAGHDRGSSHGQTRIIRQAYFEHSDYVPLLKRAYELWADLEACVEKKLYHETGLLEIGPSDGVVIPGVLASASQHELEIDRLSRDEVETRWPGFVMPAATEAVFEQRAGYLLVEDCVVAHINAAQHAGAELITDDEVVEWNIVDNGVVVKTKKAEYHGAKVVVTAGAWANDLLADLGVPLRIVLKHLHWYENNDDRYRQSSGCPTFFYEIPEGYYYGFPQFDQRGVKVAEHSQGDAIENPLTVNRDIDLQERGRVEQFLSDYLPGVSSTSAGHVTCFYTMSPDEHFIVDQHPEFDQVFFAAGMSGHGFKFTTVLGEVLADLALDGATKHPVGFLNCQRPALRS